MLSTSSQLYEILETATTSPTDVIPNTKNNKYITDIALIFIGIDGLSSVNNIYGRSVGDVLLEKTFQRIKKELSEPNTVTHLGGDEFAVMLQCSSSPQAGLLAGKLLKIIRQPYIIEEVEVHVSASMGIAWGHEGEMTAEELIEQADSAMHHAKYCGRDRYFFFEPAMARQCKEYAQMAQDLPKAIENNELSLCYQPRFDSLTNKITGVEALLRWHHPVDGFISPSLFIPAAEQIGLAGHIGRWVLEQACQQIQRWKQQKEMQDLTLSINVSALELNTPTFAEEVQSVLKNYHVAPEKMIIEITESAAMRDATASLKSLRQLSNIGVQLSLDDFGVGYSSLSHLKRMPVNELKIDRGFIRNIEHDSEDHAIVSAIMVLAEGLNLTVVAEGIETEAQHQLLTELGCHELQGFLLAEPMSPCAILKLVNKQQQQNKIDISDFIYQI